MKLIINSFYFFAIVLIFTSCKDTYKSMTSIEKKVDTLFIIEGKNDYTIPVIININRSEIVSERKVFVDDSIYISHSPSLKINGEYAAHAKKCNGKGMKQEILFIDSVSCQIRTHLNFYVDKDQIRIQGKEYDFCIEKPNISRYDFSLSVLYDAATHRSIIADDGTVDFIGLTIPVIDRTRLK